MLDNWSSTSSINRVLFVVALLFTVSVRLESGEVGTELRNTLGDGKTQESGNAEGVGKRKCGRR